MRLVVALVVAVAACSAESTPDAAVESVVPARTASPRVQALIAKYECTRCHDVPGIAAPSQDKQCFGCHQAIRAGTFDAKPDAIAKWQTRIHSLLHAPSLAATDRLQREWVKDFLLHPHEVRPGSIAQMPRLSITTDDAAELAAYLVPVDNVRPIETSELVRGEQLFRSLACARCHRFTGASVDDAAVHAAAAPLGASWVLAPDLRHARDRVQPAQLARWIAAPRGAMPDLGISDDDAHALAGFVAGAPLAPPPASAIPKRLPVLDREVTWAEVSTKVFHDQCWHCHAVPDFARGDGGPGNSGGFGFAPRGLDVSSYVGISEGSLDATGERRSVFERLPDGTPRVVAHLYARVVEEAGGEVTGVRGMPLGLPALSLEQIQLVETWIAQGRPQ